MPRKHVLKIYRNFNHQSNSRNTGFQQVTVVSTPIFIPDAESLKVKLPKISQVQVKAPLQVGSFHQ